MKISKMPKNSECLNCLKFIGANPFIKNLLLVVIITTFLYPYLSKAEKYRAKGWWYHGNIFSGGACLPMRFYGSCFTIAIGFVPPVGLGIGTNLLFGEFAYPFTGYNETSDSTETVEACSFYPIYLYWVPYMNLRKISNYMVAAPTIYFFYVFNFWSGNPFYSEETLSGRYFRTGIGIASVGVGKRSDGEGRFDVGIEGGIISYRRCYWNSPATYPFIGLRLGVMVFSGCKVEEIPLPSLELLAFFTDAEGNQNSLLESNESAKLQCKFSNKGRGQSGGIILNLSIPSELKPYLEIDEVVKTKGLRPGESRTISIPIKAKSNIPTGTYQIYISGRDTKGNQVEGSYVTIQTKQTEPPYLAFETTPFDDNQDRIFDAGEMVGFNLYVQNQGRGEAFSVKAFVKDKKGNILVEKEIGSLKPAETREVSLQFQMPTDLRTGQTSFDVGLTEMSGFAPTPKTVIVETREYAAVVFEPQVTIDDDLEGISRGNNNGAIDKGETIELNISIRNNGSGTARGVKAAIFSNQGGIEFITPKTEVGDIPSASSKDKTLVFAVKQDFNYNTLDLRLELSEMTGKFTKTFPLTFEIGKPPVIVTEGGKKFPIRKNTYALIIGINNYEDKSIPPLKYAENDAQAIELLLKNNGIENIYSLVGKNATKKNIDVRLAELERMVNEESFVYIFFSGHGSSRLFENDERYPYYLPYDADATNATALQTSCLSWADLTSCIKRMKAKGVVVAVNACFGIRPAGSAAGIGPGPVPPPKTPLGEGRVIMSGSAPNQFAYEVKEYNHSIFFHQLLKALQGDADANNDGWVDVNEAFKFVSENVQQDARTLKRTLQTPTINPEIGSLIKITRYK